MMTMPEISHDDLLAVRQFLYAAREEGRFAHVFDDQPAGAGALRARVSGLRDRRRGAETASYMGDNER